MKMRPIPSIFNLIGLISLLLLISLVNLVLGGYGTPLLIALENPPLEIVVEAVINKVTIEEEFYTTDFKIVQIDYTDDGEGIPRLDFRSPELGRPVMEVIKDDEKYYLLMKTKLDYETAISHGIGLIPGPGKIIELTVKDINDNPPYFSPDGYPTEQLEIKENIIPVVPLFRFEAKDLDKASEGKLVYSLEDLDNPTGGSSFRINETTGELFIKDELDFETRNSHRLQINVSDTDFVVKAPMVTNIRVIDMPDMPPRWTKVQTRIKLDEGLPTIKKWEYNAVDGDTDIKSPIIYSITQLVGHDFFQINSSTGELTVANEIDADILENLYFELTVTATEEYEPFEFINEIVSIEVVDINDNPPLIEPRNVKEEVYIISINEHESQMSELPIEIKINDTDATLPNSRYNVTIVETEETKFLKDALRLSPARGSGEATFSIQITNRQLIDYENLKWRGNNGEIIFNVSIVPENDPHYIENTALAIIKLSIQDINDHAPEWLNLGENQALHFTFDETVEKDYHVGIIEAIDADITPKFGNESLIYRWYQRKPMSMDLNNKTGEITVKIENAFDYEIFPEDTFLVEAVDMNGLNETGELRTVVVLNIHLKDVNDETPTIRLPSSQSKVLENSSPGTVIMDNIEVRDRDTKPDLKVTVEIITPSPDPNIDLNTWFEIVDSENSEPPSFLRKKLVVGIGEIDRELLGRIDINIIVTDHEQVKGIGNASMFLSIEIEDVNDNPPEFIRDYGDPNFEIKVTETLEFEDEQDNSTDYEKEIISFVATDKDLNQILTYKISSPYPRMEELVILNSSTGVLRRTQGVMIDREENIIPGLIDTDFLEYTVVVFDNEERHNATVSIKIKVIDINDNFPQFAEDYTLVSYNVSEDKENGTNIAEIYATDRDAGVFGTVQYFLDPDYNDGIGLDKFSIDKLSGELITLGGLDRETVPSYTLQILAVDNYRAGSTANSNRNTSRIIIKINDINDNPPEFISGMILPEKNELSTNPGDVLGEVEVIDKDEEGTDNSKIDFRLLNIECTNCNVNPEGYFYIGVSTKGFNVLANTTFKDSYGDYSLTVEAADRGNPQLSNNGTITIKINDVNDNAPEFISGMILPEKDELSTNPGDILGEVEVIDKDEEGTDNSKIDFHLLNIECTNCNVNPEGYFYIGVSTKGFNVLANTTFKDSYGDYNLTVEAADRGNPQQKNIENITIKINDINDNAPEFISGMNLPENEELNTIPGESLGEVEVIDKDKEGTDNSKIHFHLMNIVCTNCKANPEGYFYINESTKGFIVIANTTFKDSYGDYSLTVEAADRGNPQLSNNGTITIKINDVNDNAPEFISGMILPEKDELSTNPGDILGEVEVIDKDEEGTDNSKIDFHLLNIECTNCNVNPEGYFYIGVSTKGFNVLANTTFKDSYGDYNLTVEAADRGNPQQKNIENITIKINDINDNAPEFISGMNLPENEELNTIPGESLGEVEVIDKDKEGTDNSKIDFHLMNIVCTNCKANPEGYFYINESTKGFIVIANTTFEDSYGDYSLIVQATDRGSSPQSNNGNITIKIKDINDHAPIFDEPDGNRLLINETLATGSRLKTFDGVEYPNITATDEDDPTTGNGKIYFSLEGDTTNSFEIKNLAEGIIYLRRQLVVGFTYNLVIRASDLADRDPKSNIKNLTIFTVPEVNEKPIFESIEFFTNFTENENPGIVDSLEKATDKDITEDFNIYDEKICYYLTESKPNEDIFELDVNTNILSTKISLDREQYAKHELVIYARNNDNKTDCEPKESIIIDPSEPNSYLKVYVTVNDVIDVPPKFSVDGLISSGFKTTANINSYIFTFNATDEDENDVITYSISPNAVPSDSSLENLTPPLFHIDSKTGELFLLFQPSSGMKGYFTFPVYATDIGDLTTEANVKIYLVTEENVIKFSFFNVKDYVDTKYDGLSTSLKKVFKFRCNIERIAQYTDESGNIDYTKTDVFTHFINDDISEPVMGRIITAKQYENGVLQELMSEMTYLGLSFLALTGPGDENLGDTPNDNILIYSLVGGVAVATILLIIVSVSCWFNSKSLSRRVRALTASTFGSKESGLNRIGGGITELPNTNLHAIQGSNPIWSEEGTKSPLDFDTESIGSGGSVLIGVEDDEDFKNYGVGKNNPMFGADTDEFSQIKSGSGMNPLFDMDDGIESDDGNYEKLDIPKPGLNIRRNPLMNMDLSGESDQ